MTGVYVENFVNDFSTTLNNGGVVGASDTSFVVAAIPTAGGYPNAQPNFRIRIENELMLVTGWTGSGNLTWRVTRGIEGTTAASHANGLAVYIVLTAAGVAQWISDNFTKTVSTADFKLPAPSPDFPDDLNFTLDQIQGDSRGF